MLKPLALAAALAAHIAWPLAAAAETPVAAADRNALSLTVYQGGFALVADTRPLPLAAGETRLRIDGVPVQAQADSVLLRSAAPLTLLAARTAAATLTPGALLRRAVGSTVTLVTADPATGARREETAELLAAGPGGPVYRIGGRIEPNHPGRPVFDSLPPDLRPYPALLLDVAAERAGPAVATLSYLTGGVGWRADYALVLAADRNRLDLRGHVTVENRTGVAFDGASVAVVAGEVGRVRPAPRPEMAADGAVAMRAMASAPEPRRAALGDYHLYQLARPLDLAPGDSARAALVSADAVAASLLHELRGSAAVSRPARGVARQPVALRLSFANDKARGMPLPAGVARLYQAGPGGALRLLGEDRLAATPIGAEASLDIGRSFEVTATRRQTAFSRVAERRSETGWEITLANASARPVVVDIHETIPGDWQMIEESRAHTRTDAGTARWQVPVPAGGEARLRYRVRSRF